MVQLSPDTITGGDNGNGYNYCHNTIEGFSFNHMSGIGWYGDLGNLQIMPVINETEELQSENLKEFSHEDVGLILDYGDSVTDPIILKCGISYTSLDGARKN